MKTLLAATVLMLVTAATVAGVMDDWKLAAWGHDGTQAYRHEYYVLLHRPEDDKGRDPLDGLVIGILDDSARCNRAAEILNRRVPHQHGLPAYFCLVADLEYFR